MTNEIKWGVLGCGNIAQKFVSDLQYVDNSILYAVASNNKERGESFANKHNAKKVYKALKMCSKFAERVFHFFPNSSTHFKISMIKNRKKWR